MKSRGFGDFLGQRSLGDKNAARVLRLPPIAAVSLVDSEILLYMMNPTDLH